ncbi:MAG: hypothetical protein LBT37_03465 [Lactobacillaceae bacterium]|jgi:archaellum component FlaF (FlaF/FlaG flagellin family)|nr:hypothetical protein [Lactobacillaceae bacterium]
MNKVTRVLTSAIAVGVIAGTGVVGLTTPFMYAQDTVATTSVNEDTGLQFYSNEIGSNTEESVLNVDNQRTKFTVVPHGNDPQFQLMGADSTGDDLLAATDYDAATKTFTVSVARPGQTQFSLQRDKVLMGDHSSVQIEEGEKYTFKIQTKQFKNLKLLASNVDITASFDNQLFKKEYSETTEQDEVKVDSKRMQFDVEVNGEDHEFYVTGAYSPTTPTRLTATSYDEETKTFNVKPARAGQVQFLLLANAVSMSDGSLVHVDSGKNYTFNIQTKQLNNITVTGRNASVVANYTDEDDGPIEKYVQTEAVRDLNSNPWTGDYSAAEVDSFTQNLTQPKSVRAANYNHSGEYVYCRITPIADKFNVHLTLDVKNYADWDVVFDCPYTGGYVQTQADMWNIVDNSSLVVGAKDTNDISGNYEGGFEHRLEYSTNLIGENFIIDTSGHPSYTFKIAVPTKELKQTVSGIYAKGYGVKVEWFTYHQAYNG